jgi:hypothetical protein
VRNGSRSRCLRPAVLFPKQEFESERVTVELAYVWIFQIWSYPRHTEFSNPMVTAPGAGLAGKLLGTMCACAVPMGPSMIGQNIKDEPCGKRQALYLAFSPAVTQAFLEDTRFCTRFLANHLKYYIRSLHLLGVRPRPSWVYSMRILVLLYCTSL